jgi:hypothetical protein
VLGRKRGSHDHGVGGRFTTVAKGGLIVAVNIADIVNLKCVRSVLALFTGGDTKRAAERDGKIRVAA